MIRCSAPSDTSIRRAFTLFEVLIVLSIIVALASMAAPNVMEQIRENRVFQQADEVREAMAMCRTRAIENGIDYEFRYEVSGPGFLVLPADIESSVNEDGTSSTTEEYFRAAFELDEDMRLRAASGIEEESEQLDADRLSGLGSAELARKSWSKAIQFRFDGRSDDTIVRVSDEEGLTSEVSLRGLTGSVRVSQVYPDQDD